MNGATAQIKINKLLETAVIKLFLKTGNARRVLFLVDRLELKDQAKKAFVSYLANDYETVIFKENREDCWLKQSDTCYRIKL